MIQSFMDAETERIWYGQRSRKLPPDIQVVALRKLRLMNSAHQLKDLRIPPGIEPEALKGDRLGQYSIRINDQRRISFIWNDRGPSDVEIVDYHD
ncbi:type II toxin-antitoxin system RelE/ParE family toxin [Peteryoungia desertarenae]|uniref:Type II toxin-antitoxin system RelE/ParE family toxin n=1 Tax=Peteryoungia desertarenae TaxID=1813451 RepID=A0ABX6QS67_9HYPH|nr:type II toxin-antitoxin system RelE/ParE family toxin [Peteryoungia desertarenae]QLF71040.1 type II toxin-antitoxin system RelE/ParE family toxin [Peteryoungia desertarenae]